LVVDQIAANRLLRLFLLLLVFLLLPTAVFVVVIVRFEPGGAQDGPVVKDAVRTGKRKRNLLAKTVVRARGGVRVGLLK
jgi:hypothetical protein